MKNDLNNKKSYICEKYIFFLTGLNKYCKKNLKMEKKIAENEKNVHYANKNVSVYEITCLSRI